MRAGKQLDAAECKNLRSKMVPILPGCENGAQDALMFLNNIFNCLCQKGSAISQPISLICSPQRSIPIAHLLQTTFHQFTPSQTLSISLERGRNTLPIDLDQNGTMTLEFHTPFSDRPKKYIYCLEAAVRNTGKHWVFYERANSGEITLHDDRRVISSRFEEMKKSNLFRFSLVKGA